jgi:apolipoprotein N-acyltransferase
LKQTTGTLFLATLVTFQIALRTMLLLKIKKQESKFLVILQGLIVHLGYGGYVPGVKSENVFG